MESGNKGMRTLTYRLCTHTCSARIRPGEPAILSLLFFAACLASAQDTQSSHPPPAQKPDRVTTTVVVHGEVKDDYLSDPRTDTSAIVRARAWGWDMTIRRSASRARSR